MESAWQKEWVQMISDPAEIMGALTGLWCVWLAARKNVLTWPVSMISVAFYALVFYRSKLYSDALLQLFFAAFQVWGWMDWVKNKGKKNEINIQKITRKQFLFSGILIIIATYIWYTFIRSYKPEAEYPFWDSLCMCLSLAAIYLQARRYIENWLLWIVADVIYIPVYNAKSLHITAILYTVFLFMAISGWLQWKRPASEA